MLVTKNYDARRGKAIQENLTAYGGPSQTRSKRRRQQLLNNNKKDIALADAECEELEARAEDKRDQERAWFDKLEARQIRVEELAIKETALEAEVA